MTQSNSKMKLVVWRQFNVCMCVCISLFYISDEIVVNTNKYRLTPYLRQNMEHETTVLTH